MTDDIKNKEIETTQKTDTKNHGPVSNTGDFKNNNERSGFKKNKRTSKRKPTKQRSEFDQKIIDIRRVTRVASGGRRFSFSVAVVVGNKKGKVGVGTGKAGDTSLAIDKAVKDAQKKSILINTTKKMSIAHEVSAKFNSARVCIMPAPGRGLIAGSSLRDILELGGLNDLNCKIFSGSKNKLNIAKATIKALSNLPKTSDNQRESFYSKKDTTQKSVSNSKNK
ncbi:MAG TPA: 30S ribosomal protein S5 [Candidatus Paceibacterota bacterium]|nr:30S ribosomal protein S5 [Candidatus Paceibacterota bacterium]HMP19182.1 30S ribosomal protein S5 [Candidatus Paceibacterota bacterium]HMP85287.1 30S ribosomal protein S5 [Candidatus Paceibacterota bacterium]